MIDIFDYANKQLSCFFPSIIPSDDDSAFLKKFKNVTLKRYEECVKSNRIFKGDINPDPYHIMKYPIFLYILSNTIYETGDVDPSRLKDRIHAMNKALHGCAIYYTTKLSTEFFFNYATGIVLAPATFGNKLVLYHSVSITENKMQLPTIGNNVTLMPGVLVSGNSVLGDHVTVSAGTRIIDKVIDDNCVVFQGVGNEIIIKKASRNYSARYFAQ